MDYANKLQRLLGLNAASQAQAHKAELLPSIPMDTQRADLENWNEVEVYSNDAGWALPDGSGQMVNEDIIDETDDEDDEMIAVDSVELNDDDYEQYDGECETHSESECSAIIVRQNRLDTPTDKPINPWPKVPPYDSDEVMTTDVTVPTIEEASTPMTADRRAFYNTRLPEVVFHDDKGNQISASSTSTPFDKSSDVTANGSVLEPSFSPRGPSQNNLIHRDRTTVTNVTTVHRPSREALGPPFPTFEAFLRHEESMCNQTTKPRPPAKPLRPPFETLEDFLEYERRMYERDKLQRSPQHAPIMIRDVTYRTDIEELLTDIKQPNWDESVPVSGHVAWTAVSINYWLSRPTTKIAVYNANTIGIGTWLWRQCHIKYQLVVESYPGEIRFIHMQTSSDECGVLNSPITDWVVIEARLMIGGEKAAFCTVFPYKRVKKSKQENKQVTLRVGKHGFIPRIGVVNFDQDLLRQFQLSYAREEAAITLTLT